MKLRPYQEDLIQKIRDHMIAGKKRVLLQAPTGCGKTVIASEMIRSASEKGHRCGFMLHRRELINQTMNTFEAFEIPFGVTSAGYPGNPARQVQICSVQSFSRRMKNLHTHPTLFVWDEAHHCPAGSWSRIFKAYPDAFHVLLTATPERLDGHGLSEYADALVPGPQTKWLIENGYLSDYKAYAPNSVSMADVRTQMGDFNSKQAADLIDKPHITGSAVKEYLKVCQGKRAVVFAINIEHSLHIVSEFQAAGITAKHVDGTTPTNERDQAIRDFKQGRTLILSNVGLFGEGFDVPAIESLIMLRPTQSLAMYLQMVGRALRTSPGKDFAHIIDHVGNIERHGLPCQEREWTLEGREKRKRPKDGGAPVKICPTCYGAQPSGQLVCQYCKEKFPIKEREITEVDGELIELDKERIKREKRKEVGSARTYESLVALGYKRGYKSPEAWARHLLNARKGK